MFLNMDQHRWVKLPKVGSWPQAHHEFEKKSLWAINAALASRRPLLIQGEPGTGKSQLARAAAAALGRILLSYVVNARTESRDLQYTYDPLSRLADAQTASLTFAKDESRKAVLEKLHPRFFMAPGVLWWAFDWQDALEQHRNCSSSGQVPPNPDPATLQDGTQIQSDPANGTVVLLDEIDKAESDVPNGLLETLGNGGFSLPYLDKAVTAAEPFPLVVLTTNGDRELPPAFLRRCLALTLEFESGSSFIEKLTRRGMRRYKSVLDESLCREMAKKLLEDREETLKTHPMGPGQAEYFDMLEALARMKTQGIDLVEAVKEIREYIFEKYIHGISQ